MRINRLALRNLVLREMHDHMEDDDMPEIKAVIIDDEDEQSEEDSDTDVDEEGNFDYEDSNIYEETGMIKSNLFMMSKKSLELHDAIGDRDDLPEWVQEKIAVASYMIDTVHDYLMYEMVKGDLQEKKDGRSKSRKYKGKEYHATPAMVKAVKKGASYNQLAKLAKWADEPAAIVQAAKIVAKGKPMTRDDEDDLEEGARGVDYSTPKKKSKNRG